MQATRILPQFFTATATADLPPQAISEDERRDLEEQAGRKFVSDEATHRYRLRKIHSQAVNEMLAGLVRR